MKYALILKGLSYVKDLDHDNDKVGKSYTIDFDNSIQSFKDKIINPLRENGNDVDIYFNTNSSEKLDKYIENLEPICVSKYEYSHKKSSWALINKLIYDGLLLVKNKGINYDYIIVTRFDIYIFENIMNVLTAYIPDIGLSTTTPNNDCFFIFNGSLLDKMLNVFRFLYTNNEISHRYPELSQMLGIKVHTFYNYTGACTKESMQVPFYRINRHIFLPKDHSLFIHSLEEALDPSSKHYALQHPINTSYTSGVFIAPWFKPYSIKDLEV